MCALPRANMPMLDSRRTHSTEQTQSTSHEFAKGSQVKAKGVLLIQSGADMHIDASQLQGDQGVALLSAGQLAITGQTLQVSCPSVRNSVIAEFQPLFFSKISLSGLVFDGVVALVGAALCLLFVQNLTHTQALSLADADSAV